MAYVRWVTNYYIKTINSEHPQWIEPINFFMSKWLPSAYFICSCFTSTLVFNFIFINLVLNAFFKFLLYSFLLLAEALQIIQS